MRTEVDGYVAQLNARLNRWETIKKFLLLEHDLTVESGELTPSMKVKRKVVEDNHHDAAGRPLPLTLRVSQGHLGNPGSPAS